MAKITFQSKKWSGKFGREYADRSIITLNELDNVYRKNFGITRTELNSLFVGKLKKNIKILEVGSNVGNQLLFLHKMGFNNLYGIEINSHALECSKSRTKNISTVQGSVVDIPFKDEYFDVVFSSGVLIHVHPKDIKKAYREIHRCTKKYIWGYEYYAEKYTEIIYRERKNLLWKANFSKLYLKLFDDLKLVKEKKLQYLNNDNIDTMFLLRKKK